MISLGAMQSAAIALLALLLFASTCVSVGEGLRQRDAKAGVEGGAFQLARQIDAFYRSACGPGFVCVAAISLPDGEVTVGDSGIKLVRGGFNATGPTLAPLSQAAYSINGSSLVLRWDS